jgi:hypothetical protein
LTFFCQNPRENDPKVWVDPGENRYSYLQALMASIRNAPSQVFQHYRLSQMRPPVHEFYQTIELQSAELITAQFSLVMGWHGRQALGAEPCGAPWRWRQK